MSAVAAFLVICYALSITLSLAIGTTGGHRSPLIGLSYLAMFLPAAAVALVTVRRNAPPRVPWTSFPTKYLPIALFLIPGVLHAVMLPAMAWFGGGVHWQPWLTRSADGLYHVPAPRGWGAVTTQGLTSHIAVNALVGVLVVSFLAFFEEIGWRAWLLPRLTNSVGARRGVVLTSAIWAFWHVPFQLSGIQYIQGVSPATLAVSMTLGIMATGLVLGWLWLRTESIWLVSIAHGSANNWGQYAFKYMRDSGRPDIEMVALNLGSLALLFVGLFLLWCNVKLGSDNTVATSRSEIASQ